MNSHNVSTLSHIKDEIENGATDDIVDDFEGKTLGELLELIKDMTAQQKYLTRKISRYKQAAKKLIGSIK